MNSMYLDVFLTVDEIWRWEAADDHDDDDAYEPNSIVNRVELVPARLSSSSF